VIVEGRNILTVTPVGERTLSGVDGAMPAEQTAYEVLGVSTDATEDTIKAAYQERVKETHPDVSDAPDTDREFRRVQTARDILLDTGERARYDRLGHLRYVHTHLTDSDWPGADDLPEPAHTNQQPPGEPRSKSESESDESDDSGVTPPPKEPQNDEESSPGGLGSSRSRPSSSGGRRRGRSVDEQSPSDPWWDTSSEEYRSPSSTSSSEPPHDSGEQSDETTAPEDTREDQSWEETDVERNRGQSESGFQTGANVQTQFGTYRVNRGLDYLGGLLVTHAVFLLSSLVLAWISIQNPSPQFPVFNVVGPMLPVLAVVFSYFHLASELS